jgi:hypothetical protein
VQQHEPAAGQLLLVSAGTGHDVSGQGDSVRRDPSRWGDLGQDDLGPDPGGVHLFERAPELLWRITGCLSLSHLGRVGPHGRPALPAAQGRSSRSSGLA